MDDGRKQSSVGIMPNIKRNKDRNKFAGGRHSYTPPTFVTVDSSFDVDHAGKTTRRSYKATEHDNHDIDDEHYESDDDDNDDDMPFLPPSQITTTVYPLDDNNVPTTIYKHVDNDEVPTTIYNHVDNHEVSTTTDDPLDNNNVTPTTDDQEENDQVSTTNTPDLRSRSSKKHSSATPPPSNSTPPLKPTPKQEETMTQIQRTNQALAEMHRRMEKNPVQSISEQAQVQEKEALLASLQKKLTTLKMNQIRQQKFRLETKRRLGNLDEESRKKLFEKSTPPGKGTDDAGQQEIRKVSSSASMVVHSSSSEDYMLLADLKPTPKQEELQEKISVERLVLRDLHRKQDTGGRLTDDEKDELLMREKSVKSLQIELNSLKNNRIRQQRFRMERKRKMATLDEGTRKKLSIKNAPGRPFKAGHERVKADHERVKADHHQHDQLINDLITDCTDCKGSNNCKGCKDCATQENSNNSEVESTLSQEVIMQEDSVYLMFKP